MVEVYLNDELIDLYPETIIAESFEIKNIGDISAGKGNSTNQFKIPKTNRNKLILENIDSVYNTSEIPYNRISARIVNNGIETTKGFALIKDAGKEFNIEIYSGNADIFDLIEGLTIKDVDALTDRVNDFRKDGAFKHNWGCLELSQYGDKSGGFCYPVLQYSSDELFLNNTDSNSDIRLMFPSVFAHTLFTGIFDNQGWTIEGDILTNSNFLNELVPQIDNFLPSSYESTEAINSIESVNIQLMQWTAPFNEWYLFEGNELSVTVTVRARRASGILAGFKIQIEPEGGVSQESGNITLTGSFATYSHTFSSVELGTVLGDVSFDLLPDIFVRAVDSVGEIEYDYVSIHVDFIKATKFITLPDISQTDFVKTIAIKYGLIYQSDVYNKKITFYSFDKLKENIPSALDWSSKLINDDSVVSFEIPGFAQKNYLKYKDDKLNSDSNFSGYFESSNENLPLSKDVAVLPFAASNEAEVMAGELVCKIPIFENGNFKNKPEPRLINLYRKNKTINFIISSFDSFEKTDSYIFSSFENQDLQTFVDANYNVIVDMLNQAKIVKAKFKLNVLDVHQIDFMTPIYMEQFGAYFFRNKISNFRPDKLTEVELIRL